MPEERAFGAAVIAVIIGIIGVFILFTGILELFAWALSQNWGSFSGAYFFSWLSNLPTGAAAAIVIVLGLIFIGVALGLYRQHFWALVVMFVVGVVYLAGEISGVANKLFYASPTVPISDPNIIGSIIAIGVVVIVLAYLAAVRDDFI